jgi:hypothetical protein
MSQGTKIPFRLAYAIGGKVMGVLRSAAALNGQAAEANAVHQLDVVGSMRREREMIGDLEVLAPFPLADDEETKIADEDDPLYRVLCRVVSNPPAPKGLFAQPATTSKDLILGTADKGLKPGFKYCKITLMPKLGPNGEATPIGLDIFRATRESWGWAQLRCTGPAEFGEWFLKQWKRRWGIPPTSQASIKGHLVDARGDVVEVLDEDQAFRLCGLNKVDSRDRDRFMERVATAKEHLR